MKQLLFFLNFILISSTLSALNESRNLDAFNELSVDEGIIVDLILSESNSAEINVDNGDVADLITYVKNGTLSIYWRKGMGMNRSARVSLNYINLNSISTSSGAKVMSDFILKSNQLDLEASSGGEITLQVDCKSIEADLSSGAILFLKGKAGKQNIDASSGAAFKGKELVGSTVTIDASSGAKVLVHE